MPLRAIPIGPPQYVETYPAVVRSVPLIRERATLVLDIWSMKVLKDPVRLIASELSANAIRHCAGKTFEVAFLRIDQGVRVSVTDSSRQVPMVRAGAHTDESGRGLLIIDMTATRWGVDKLAAGKTVWAELLITQ